MVAISSAQLRDPQPGQGGDYDKAEVFNNLASAEASTLSFQALSNADSHPASPPLQLGGGKAPGVAPSSAPATEQARSPKDEESIAEQELDTALTKWEAAGATAAQDHTPKAEKALADAKASLLSAASHYKKVESSLSKQFEGVESPVSRLNQSAARNNANYADNLIRAAQTNDIADLAVAQLDKVLALQDQLLAQEYSDVKDVSGMTDKLKLATGVYGKLANDVVADLKKRYPEDRRSDVVSKQIENWQKTADQAQTMIAKLSKMSQKN